MSNLHDCSAGSNEVRKCSTEGESEGMFILLFVLSTFQATLRIYSTFVKLYKTVYHVICFMTDFFSPNLHILFLISQNCCFDFPVEFFTNAFLINIT